MQNLKLRKLGSVMHDKKGAGGFITAILVIALVGVVGLLAFVAFRPQQVTPTACPSGFETKGGVCVKVGEASPGLEGKSSSVTWTARNRGGDDTTVAIGDGLSVYAEYSADGGTTWKPTEDYPTATSTAGPI